MSLPRLVPAPISIYFSEAHINLEAYEREYQMLSESDDDPISQWLKLAKARGDTRETDPVLLELVVELHRKIDTLEMFLKDEVPSRLPLVHKNMIDHIGFEHFHLKSGELVDSVLYYGRIEMPVYPKHDVGVFFEAENASLAKIVKIHERDEREWGAYMTARERIQIRELKGKQ